MLSDAAADADELRTREWRVPSRSLSADHYHRWPAADIVNN